MIEHGWGKREPLDHESEGGGRVEEYKVDRTGWSSGPWDGEPDRLSWKTEAGLPALIVRNSSGALCGYVGLPAGTAVRDALDSGVFDYHLERYDDIPGVESPHGGITYGSRCRGHICHVPEPGETDDVYWLGFDCGHAGDLVPGLLCHLTALGLPLDHHHALDVYRDVAYVRAECERFAAELMVLR